MNNSLIRAALSFIRQSPMDPTLRAGLLNAGYSINDVDCHLDYMGEERLAAIYSTPNGPPVWRLKLRGKELLEQANRPPIGFTMQ